MIVFCESYKLLNRIKQRTYIRNPNNPSCIDSLFTNKLLSFRTPFVLETGMSDFHKITVTVMKMHFPKMKTGIINYRKYRKYESFWHTLKSRPRPGIGPLEKAGSIAKFAV